MTSTVLPRVLSISSDKLLIASGADGAPYMIAAQTLRHACTCGDCIDEKSGQRRSDVSRWPPKLTIASAKFDPSDLLHVRFKEDSHRTTVNIGDFKTDPFFNSASARNELWDASLDPEAVTVSWQRLNEPLEHHALLERLAHFGFAIVSGCPAQPGFITRLAPYVGRIKESRVGPLFDVRFDPSPSNLAFSADELFLHTDNPYRNPVPGWQILHCIVNTSQGGDSYVVDGFACADHLKRNYPEYYASLTETLVTFAFRSTDAHFSSRRPVIALDDDGHLVQVSFNDRSLRPVLGAVGEVERFYAAYRRYRRLLADPAYQVRFKLQPGQAFIVNNFRVLHARGAFPATAARHLQGAYLDSDWVNSNFLVAHHKHTGDHGYVA
ncbi:TauD/TfdA family dioxygenase [Paraburkholderia denitrificans]|uniref:TauD/TfdA family dioxygenase n=1 Tax=Paraburkholderia denitrificans TaxID=694025 RepID=A0ABW0J7B2_9BURK